jgi:tryptophan synthase alpha chain
MADAVLTHFVAGYPGMPESLEIGRAMAAGGACGLEIQFPYTDPVADGPVIQNACQKALEAGFRLDEGFRLTAGLRRELPGLPIFIMSYAGLVCGRGVQEFTGAAAAAGASGLIVPDLTAGQDEGLYAACRAAGLACVPVVVPDIAAARLEEILALRPEWLYAALRRGITGSQTKLSPAIAAFLGMLRGRGVRIMAGFGIASRAQVRELAGRCDAVIVGSELVRTIERAGAESRVRAVKDKVQELVG